MNGTNICPLCNREMPKGTYNKHHLVPTTFNGKETVNLHNICHDKLHHSLSEKEMQHYYHTVKRLLEHPEIKKFVKWVKKYPPEFYINHKDSQNRKKKRRK